MSQVSKPRIHYRVFSAVFTVLASGFFISYAIDHFKDIPSVQWGHEAIGVLAFSVALIVLSIGIGGLIWQFLLRDHDITVSNSKIQEIFLVAQFGKYLPGNVGQHVGRVYMAREAGVPLAVTINTMLMEVFWGAGVGAGLGLLSLLFFVDPASLTGFVGISPMALALLLPVALLLPWLGIRFINFFLPWLARKLSGGGRIVEPRLQTAVVVAGLFALSFLIMGIILHFQAQWLFRHAGGSIIELTCLFAIAWIAGYLMPGAPAGLGIREAMMIVLLTPIFGSGVAVGLSITLRMTTTLGDVLAFLIGIFARWSSRKHLGDSL